MTILPGVLDGVNIVAAEIRHIATPIAMCGFILGLAQEEPVALRRALVEISRSHRQAVSETGD